jgi:hypothetical protein
LKVLFIHPNIGTHPLPPFVPGLGSLPAYLGQAGPATGLITLNEKMEREQYGWSVWSHPAVYAGKRTDDEGKAIPRRNIFS